MENHIKAWRAHRVLTWIYGLLLLWVGYLVFRGYGAAGMDLRLVLSGALLLLLIPFHALAGRASLARRPWARVASIGVGFLLLAAFPVGTVIGAYLIAASWNPWNQPMTHGSPAASGWPADAVRDRPRVSGR